MTKYILITFVLLINTSYILYSGNALRRTKESDTFGQITQEIEYLLQTIYTNDCQNRRQLHIRIIEAMEKRLSDATTFPVFNNLTRDQSFRNNTSLQHRLGKILHTTTLHFLKKKFPNPQQQSNGHTIIDMRQSID